MGRDRAGIPAFPQSAVAKARLPFDACFRSAMMPLPSVAGVPRTIREILLQEDPDFRDAFLNMLALIRDAYDRGVISWARRCEMMDMMGEKDGGGLYERRDYEKPYPDPEVMCLGVFVEPSSAFLTKIGITGWTDRCP